MVAPGGWPRPPSDRPGWRLAQWFRSPCRLERASAPLSARPCGGCRVASICEMIIDRWRSQQGGPTGDRKQSRHTHTHTQLARRLLGRPPASYMRSALSSLLDVCLGTPHAQWLSPSHEGSLPAVGQRHLVWHALFQVLARLSTPSFRLEMWVIASARSSDATRRLLFCGALGGHRSTPCFMQCGQRRVSISEGFVVHSFASKRSGRLGAARPQSSLGHAACIDLVHVLFTLGCEVDWNIMGRRRGCMVGRGMAPCRTLLSFCLVAQAR